MYDFLKLNEKLENLTVVSKTGITGQKQIPAFCDICDCEDFGTPEQLKKAGWFLGQREQFCPEHND